MEVLHARCCGLDVHKKSCVGRLGYPLVPSTALTRGAAAVHSGSAPPAYADPQCHLLSRRILPMLTRLFHRCAQVGCSLDRASAMPTCRYEIRRTDHCNQRACQPRAH